ncbi:MAG: universal stress protein [Pseudomonadota bacterium]
MIPKRILLATDFSENSTAARECAADYARAFDAELLILHVVDPSPLGCPIFHDRVPVDMAELQKNIEAGAQQELDSVAADCASDLRSVRAFYRTGKPAHEIVAFADEELIDLIVMGTHGWTGFKHIILGSTAENVVRSANCPVLTVRSANGAE